MSSKFEMIGPGNQNYTVLAGSSRGRVGFWISDLDGQARIRVEFRKGVIGKIEGILHWTCSGPSDFVAYTRNQGATEQALKDALTALGIKEKGFGDTMPAGLSLNFEAPHWAIGLIMPKYAGLTRVQVEARQSLPAVRVLAARIRNALVT